MVLHVVKRKLTADPIRVQLQGHAFTHHLLCRLEEAEFRRLGEHVQERAPEHQRLQHQATRAA